jgi:hypothetical protein
MAEETLGDWKQSEDLAEYDQEYSVEAEEEAYL